MLNRARVPYISMLRSSARSRPELGRFAAILFSFCLMLFMAQPWSPKLRGLPLQVVVIWLLFAFVCFSNARAPAYLLSIFSPLQWGMIIILVGSILTRTLLDGASPLRLGQIVTGCMIALMGGLAFQTEQGRSIIVRALTLGAAASGGFAILQRTSTSLWLWQRSIFAGSGYVYGSTGLEGTPVAFPYSVLGIAVYLSACLLAGSRAKLGVRWPSALLTFCLVMLGLVFANSRSGVLGLGIGMATIALGLRSADTPKQKSNYLLRRRYVDHRKRLRTLLLNIMVFAVIIGMVAYAMIARQTGVSADPRIRGTWHTYPLLIFRYPLGMPAETDRLDALDQTELSREDVDILVTRPGTAMAPHNLLLSTGIAYGPIAAVALAVLYISPLKNARRKFLAALRSDDVAGACWILAIIAANAAIIAHSWFHNANLVLGEMRNWLWLGLLAVASKPPNR